MRKWNRAFALLLALMLALSCMSMAVFAEAPSAAAVENTVAERDLHSKRGVWSERKDKNSAKNYSFLNREAYHFAEDEIVRAIVVLKGQPTAAVSSKVRASSVGQLAMQRAAVQDQCRKASVDYKVVYDFTTLLNGMSIDVAYGDLEKLAAMPGVKSVHIANQYKIPELLPPTDGSSDVTGAWDMWTNGFKGQGKVIAVLDSGLNVDHEAFQVYDDVLGEVALTEDDVKDAIANGVEHGQYLSKKVPFAYDYMNKDDGVVGQESHGTHVAGIAAGYVRDEEEGAVTFTGAAPGAQLVIMKVFPDDPNSYTSTDVYFKALEDAYKLGVDVVNMSLGSQNGFIYDYDLEGEFGNIYEIMEEHGVVMCVAAGNENSQAEGNSAWAGPGYVTADYADYGVVGTPSTYADNCSVASANSMRYPAYVISVGEKNFQYTDSLGMWRDFFGDCDLDYVMIPGVGTEEDFEAVADPEEGLAGMIAVVQRGEISFQEKIDTAAMFGADGVIVYDNVDEPLNMNMQLDPETWTPAIFTTYDAGQALAAQADDDGHGVVSVPAEMQNYEDGKTGKKMSDFTAWGTTPDLTFKPTITSVGGNVYSAVLGGTDAYDIYSGTSMATPNLAGNTATLLEALEEAGVTDKVKRMELAKDLLESSAQILTDENDVCYSPRRQGAGLGRVDLALDAYRTGAYLKEPLVELCDDMVERSFHFDVTLVNPQDTDVTYTTSSVVLRDAVMELDGTIYNTLKPQILEGAAVECAETVTVPANGEKTVAVTLTLSPDAMAQMEADFAYGGFVEGYLTFRNEANQVHASFMGFCGDWTEAPVLENGDFRDAAEALYMLSQIPQATNTPGASLADIGVTYFDVLELNTDVTMGFLMNSYYMEPLAFAGDNILDYAEYNEAHISFSNPYLSNADEVYGDSIFLLPMQLRNAEHLVMTVTDKESGKVYLEDDTTYCAKAVYNFQEGFWEDRDTIFSWDGLDEETGEYVPSGTVATVSFDAQLPYKDAWQRDILTFDVTVDYESPEISAVTYDSVNETLTVTAADEHYLQAIYLTNEKGSILAEALFSSDEAGEEFTAVFEVGELMAKDVFLVNVCAMDYASNERVQSNVFLGQKGQPVTVTLHTPAGETKLDWFSTGDTFVVPSTDMGANVGGFTGWTTAPVEELVEEDVSEYRAADKFTLTGDLDLYALYAVSHVETLEDPGYFYMNDEEPFPANLSGQYAIVGLPLDNYSFGSRMEDPYVLTKDAESARAQDTLANYENPGDHSVFYTSDDSICWTLKDSGYGDCIIQNTVTGEYLVGDPDTLELSTSPNRDDASTWYVEQDEERGANIVLEEDFDTCLLMVDYPECGREMGLALFHDSEKIDATNAGWMTEPVKVTPSEYYYVWLYRYLTELLVVDGYTTSPDAAPVEGDREELAAMIDLVESMLGDEGDYTEESWAMLLEALAIAKEIYVDEEADGESIGEAIQMLADALDSLELKDDGGEADKSELRSLVEELEQLVESDYIDGWEALQEALDLAREILDDPEATEDDIFFAMELLFGAMEELTPDKSLLQELVAQAETLQEEDYESGWEALQEALGFAQEVLEDEYAVPEIIHEAETALMEALDGLVEKEGPEAPDKSRLQALVKKAEALDEDDYTAASWNRLENALALAKTVLADADASGEEILAAEHTLRTALNKLEKRSEIHVPVVPGRPAKPTAPSGLPFGDVRTGDWFYDAVAYVYNNDLMLGTGGDKFSPNMEFSRAMVTQILYRLEGKPAVEYKATFSDVADGQWYTDAVLWANSQGIVLGYNTGKFGPNDSVTVEQLLLILQRYAKSEGCDVSAAMDPAYKLNGKVSPFAVDAAKWAVAEDLLSRTLVPTAPATRAQVADILMNFCEEVVK